MADLCGLIVMNVNVKQGFWDHIYGEAGRGWCFHIAAEGEYFRKGKRGITSKVCRGGEGPSGG